MVGAALGFAVVRGGSAVVGEGEEVVDLAQVGCGVATGTGAGAMDDLDGAAARRADERSLVA